MSGTSETGGRFAMVSMRPQVAALPGSVLKVCLALAAFCSPKEPKAWPSQRRLGEMLGVSERKVRAWLTSAREAGMVTWTRRPTPRAVCEYDLAGFWMLAAPPQAADSKRRESRRYEAARKSPVKAAENPPVKAARKSPVSSEHTRELTNESIKTPSAPDGLMISDSPSATVRSEVVAFLMEARKVTERQARAIAGENWGWDLAQWRECIRWYEAWLGRKGLRPDNAVAHLRSFVREHGAEVLAGAEAQRAEEAHRREKRRRTQERNARTQRELEARPAEPDPEALKVLEERKEPAAQQKEDQAARGEAVREATLADIPRFLEAGNLQRAHVAFQIARENGWAVPPEVQQRLEAACAGQEVPA